MDSKAPRPIEICQECGLKKNEGVPCHNCATGRLVSPPGPVDRSAHYRRWIYVSFAWFALAFLTFELSRDLARAAGFAGTVCSVTGFGWFWIRSAVISAIMATRTVSEG